MKTKFFKKLSLVLVVAMVLSLFVPAAGAFAAAKPKLNSTNKYLHLSGKPGPNEYNFNIRNKQKGWKYYWESDDEAIVEVNEKNGVATAVAVGKTKISVVITDKDGEEVETLTAKVTVRDNIKEVTISNPVEKLAVGAEHDYNRSFVTESGSTKKTDSITRWTVEPADKATINDKGVFVATEAGEFTVTARSFQSKARHKAWEGDPEKYADYVLDFDTTKVVVSAFMVEAKQKNLSKVDVLFSSPMTKDEVKDKIYINYMIDNVAIKEQKIKDIKMSADGKTATVEIYDTFVPKSTYKVTYEGMDDEHFVAATTNPEDVVGIKITTDKSTIYKSTPIAFELLNADGVVINQPIDVNNLGVRVTFENSNNLTSLYNNEIMIFKAGEVTTVTATYHTYVFTNGIEKIYKDSQVVVGVEESDIYAKEFLAWTIVNNNDPNFGDVKHFIAEEDYGYRLFVELLLSNDAKISNKDNDLVKLTSSNSNILFVDETGYLVPVRDGVVTVAVEYDKKFVASFNVTVNAKRKAARLVVEDAYYSLSNAVKGSWTDKVTVTAKLVDQYGDDFTSTSMKMRAVSTLAIAKAGTSAETLFEGEFNPGGLNEGRYQYLIYDSAYPALTGQVTFDVKAPNSGAETWKVNITGNYKDGKVDVVVKNSGDKQKQFNVELMGYAKNNVKVGPENLAEFDVTIKDDKGKSLPGGATVKGSNSTYNSTWVDDSIQWKAVSGSAIKVVSGSAIEKLEVGQYTVEILTKDNKEVRGRTIFTVVDSQDKPSLNVLQFRTAFTGINAFTDSFEIKLNNSVVVNDYLAPIWERTNINTRAYAKGVLVRQDIKDADGNATEFYIRHKLDIKYYITVPVDFDSYSN